jgi:hypothetical protein
VGPPLSYAANEERSGGVVPWGGCGGGLRGAERGVSGAGSGDRSSPRSLCRMESNQSVLGKRSCDAKPIEPVVMNETKCKVGRMTISIPVRDLNKDVDTKTIRDLKGILIEIRKQQMEAEGEVRDDVFSGLVAYVKGIPNQPRFWRCSSFATYLAIRNCLQSYEVWQSKQPYASLLDKTPFRLAKVYVGKQLRDELKEYLLARANEDLCGEFASLYAFDNFYSIWVTDEEFLFKKPT